jgi:succinoglycan biosynthesis protein ExoM
VQDVLIGIPTFRRPEQLRACLESVIGQGRIVVADNDAERREGIAVAVEFGVASILVEERGISQVRNAILRYGREHSADFIAMLDDDETASPHWIASLLEMAAATQAGVIGGPAHPVYASPPSDEVVQSGVFDVPDFPDGWVERLYSTNNFMVSDRLLYKVDWPAFNPDYGLTGGGDREWFARLYNAGATFAWASNAATYEHIPEQRARAAWALRRSFRCGIDDVRIGNLEQPFSTIRNIGAALGTLALAPIHAIRLPTKRRLRVLCHWSRAAGRLSGAMGFRLREYA